MATRYKVVLQDENGTVLGEKLLTVVETIQVKHAIPGDAGVLRQLNTFVTNMIRNGESQLLKEAIAQGDALGLTPSDFSNGLTYAIQKEWVLHPSYKDAETKELG